MYFLCTSITCKQLFLHTYTHHWFFQVFVGKFLNLKTFSSCVTWDRADSVLSWRHTSAKHGCNTSEISRLWQLWRNSGRCALSQRTAFLVVPRGGNWCLSDELTARHAALRKQRVAGVRLRMSRLPPSSGRAIYQTPSTPQSSGSGLINK